MMNYIWSGLILLSLVVSIFTGNISAASGAAMESAKETVQTVISLLGIMCFWMGLMKIADKSGLINKFSVIMRPVIKLLFKDIKSEKAKDAILMNITANIFGIGNAATPFGLKAMEEMQKENTDKKTASNAMCMFVVINTASIQLIPTNLFALRSAYGSKNPFEITGAVWVASVVALIVGVICTKINERRKS